jgi:hypothetical protein
MRVRLASTALTDMNCSAATSWFDRPAATSPATRRSVSVVCSSSGTDRRGRLRRGFVPPTGYAELVKSSLGRVQRFDCQPLASSAASDLSDRQPRSGRLERTLCSCDHLGAREDLCEFAERLEAGLLAPGRDFDEPEPAQESTQPVRESDGSRPYGGTLGDVTRRVQIACVFLDQRAGHVFLQANLAQAPTRSTSSRA